MILSQTLLQTAVCKQKLGASLASHILSVPSLSILAHGGYWKRSGLWDGNGLQDQSKGNSTSYLLQDASFSKLSSDFTAAVIISQRPNKILYTSCVGWVCGVCVCMRVGCVCMHVRNPRVGCVCVHMDSVYNVRHVCVCVCVVHDTSTCEEVRFQVETSHCWYMKGIKMNHNILIVK